MVIIIGGYQDALGLLRTRYGAVIEHDDALDVDLISLPNEADPIARFFEIITTEQLGGRPLLDYFRLVEITSQGDFGAPEQQPAKPVGALPFPSDPYFLNQWNLVWTRMLEAQWFPQAASKAVKVALIDSGIGADDRAAAGLDGVEIVYHSVAPTTAQPAPHAFGVATLLADAANDGDGIAGLLGRWQMTSGCSAPPKLFSRRPPQLSVYNVGDFGPISVFVARALYDAVDEGADVINLSLALAYSPTVEEAVRYALDHNVVVVAAAGNYAPEVRSKPAKFPANIPGVLAVGSANLLTFTAGHSANTGLSVLAPGEHLVVGASGGGWTEVYGTSFAAPHVTAAAAMLRALRPDLPASAIADALGDRSQKYRRYGAGFLNVLSAVNQVLPAQKRVRFVELPLGCLAAGKNDPAAAWPAYDYDHRQDDDLFAAAEAPELPRRVSLEGAYPNPFNPAAVVRFSLPEATHVQLAVYNALGQQVAVLADAAFAAGAHQVAFDAGGLPSGVYFARLTAGASVEVRPMTLAK